MKSLESVVADALQLPADQRLTAAHRILASVEPETKALVEAAWDLEIRERIEKYKTGQTTTYPADEVLAELDKKLKQ